MAKVTTGSLRDATNLLEQLITYYGNSISLAQAQAMLGISGDLRIRELARYIVAMDVSSGLKVINAVAGEGLDLRQFNRELVDYMRQLLLAKSGSADMIDATSDDLAEMQKIAGSTTLDYLLNSIKLFSSVDLRMDTYSPLPLELALVESVVSQHARDKSAAADQPSGREWQSSRPAAPTLRINRPAEQARPASLVSKPNKVAEAPLPGFRATCTGR